MIGIVVDPDGDLDGIEALRLSIFGAGMVPLLIAPHGGTVGGLTVQRTFATARSVEFDVVLVAGAPAPAPDALTARDEKAGAGAGAVDPRVVLLLEECFRHAKVIGAWGEGVTALAAAGCPTSSPGIITGKDASDVFTSVQDQMAFHRVWERFTQTPA
jgi:catalase